MPSKIATNLQPDPPLNVGAGYTFNAQDRSYIDAQARGCETHLAVELINGVHATYVTVDPTSAQLNPGDVVCSANSASGQFTVTKALTSPIAVAGSVFGIALAVIAPGAVGLFALHGYLSPAVTGLPVASAGPVILNASTGRAQYTATLSSGNYSIGSIDNNGWLTLTNSGKFNSSGGSGATTLTGDATGTISFTNIATTVAGIRNQAIPALATGYLYWSGSAFSWNSAGSSFVAGGDLSGTITSQQVIAATGSAGVLPLASTAAVITWATGASSPGLAQTI